MIQDTMLGFFIRLLQKVLNIAISAKKKLSGGEYNIAAHNSKVIQSTQKYDMVVSPDEPYYQEQYWHWIKKYLDIAKLPASGTYLDLGCGQGRLSIPLARWCADEGKVIGVDFSKKAIEKAQEYAIKAGLSNVGYHAEDILSFLKSKSSNLFDAILFLEVIFFMPQYHLVLQEIKRVLKPQGLLFVSFRSQYFYALHSVVKRNFGDIDTILKNRMGRLSGGDVCFTWQTSGEIRHLIEKELELEMLDLCGIGCCSGIEGDPHAFITQPSLLDQNERDALMKLEITLANSVPDAGRYMLCIARKK